MIRINLLGDVKTGDPNKMLWIVGYLGSIVLLVGGVIYYSGTIKEQLERKVEVEKTLERELEELSEKTKLVKTLEGKKRKLKNKLRLIAQLKKGKVGPVRVLDDLNNAVPSKVWLMELSEGSRLMRLKGRALTNQDIALFMKNLEGSEYFVGVELKESRQMYYSKKTGAVQAGLDISAFKQADFTNSSRILKDSKGQRKGPRVREGQQDIQERYVEIHEFVLTTRVKYAGALELDKLKEANKKK